MVVKNTNDDKPLFASYKSDLEGNEPSKSTNGVQIVDDLPISSSGLNFTKQIIIAIVLMVLTSSQVIVKRVLL